MSSEGDVLEMSREEEICCEVRTRLDFYLRDCVFFVFTDVLMSLIKDKYSD